MANVIPPLRALLADMAKRKGPGATDAAGTIHAMAALSPGIPVGVDIDAPLDEATVARYRRAAIRYAQEQARDALPGTLGESSAAYALRLLAYDPMSDAPIHFVDIRSAKRDAVLCGLAGSEAWPQTNIADAFLGDPNACPTCRSRFDSR